MKYGELWTAVFSGDYGKPRPAVVVQSARMSENHPSVVLCPITSDLVEDTDFRITIEPSPTTGLRKRSQVMVDKVTALPKTKVREQIGRLEKGQFIAVHQALLFVIGAMDTSTAD